MTGFQLRLVAEAATETLAAGVPPSQVAPFWRAVDPGTRIAGKLPDGSTMIERLRQLER